jgi:hypothetical protein
VPSSSARDAACTGFQASSGPLKIHVHTKGAWLGPLSLEELAAHLAAQRILSTDVVRCEGGNRKAPVGRVLAALGEEGERSVRRLFGLEAPPEPPPRPVQPDTRPSVQALEPDRPRPPLEAEDEAGEDLTPGLPGRMYKLLGADGEEDGPFSAKAVRQLARQGRINARTLLRAVGYAEWQRAARFPEFADVVPSAGSDAV